MAFEANLPASSERFSQILWKDPNDRIWTGKTGEYYRFLDPADLPYINIKDFGAVGDGVTDDTDAWDEALSAAKALEMALFIPSGKFPIDVNQNTVNMNGCLGITGDGELIFTWSGDRPDLPLLQWQGEKTQVATGIAVSRYQNTFTIPTGLSLSRGDAIFFVTNELIVSDMTVNYCKGMRFTVDNYDSATGDLTTYEYSHYNMASATVWHNTVRPRVKLQGVKMAFSTDTAKKMLEVIVGEVYIDYIKMSGFSIVGFNCSSSLARITNSEILTVADPDNTTTGYAVQSSGLTDMYIGNCNLYGYRHGFAAGDHGYWKNGDAGGTPPETIIQMPSVVKISGGRAEGNLFAIDSHGGTTLLDVYMCDIYGGVQLGGVESYVSNSRIYQTNFDRDAIRLGRDRPSGNGVYHGRYAVRNCEIYVSKEVMNVWADIEAFTLSDVNVYPTASASARDFFGSFGNSRIKTFNLRNLTHVGNTGDDVTYTINAMFPATISGVKLINARLYAYARNIGVDFKIINCDIENPGKEGLYVRSVNGANRTFSVLMVGTSIRNCATGMTVADAQSLQLTGCQMSGNTASVVLQNRVSGTIRFMAANSEFNQASGNVVALSMSQITESVFIGNHFVQSGTIAIPDAQIIGKYGNTGLNDKLKTALSSASTPKYGADTTTGDLTLS